MPSESRHRVVRLVLTVIAFTIAAILSGIIFGCSRWTPVAVEDHSVDQFQAVSLVISRCNEIGVKVNPEITHDVQCTPVEVGYEDTLSFDDVWCPSTTQVPAAMWASNGTVWIWDQSVEMYSQEKLDAYARHECCHLKLHHTSNPAFEADADACARNMYD
jgi:hypothetical protein